MRTDCQANDNDLNGFVRANLSFIAVTTRIQSFLVAHTHFFTPFNGELYSGFFWIFSDFFWNIFGFYGISHVKTLYFKIGIISLQGSMTLFKNVGIYIR